jgi:hypothetical protein
MTKSWSTRVLLLAVLLAFAGVAAAQDKYQVTVTSILHGTPSTLIPSYPASVFVGTACPDNGGAGTRRVGEMLGLWLFATHAENVQLFTVGQPARRELALLSQTGRPFFLRDSLAGKPGWGQVFSIPASFPPPNGPGGIVLCPGESLTTTVTAKGNKRYLSVAAMIFPTNDGFVGVSSVRLPEGNDPVVVYSPAYDSGTEENDELCGNIPSLIFAGFPFPGTTIGGAGKMAGAACPDGLGADNDINSDPTDPASPDNDPLRAEGYVHIHPGIRGIGDLDPRVWGWENSVLKITIQKVED